MAVDVVQQRRKTSSRPVLTVNDHLKTVPPNSDSPESHHFYNRDWTEVLALARSLILSRVILDNAFPNKSNLWTDSVECLMDAFATIRVQPSIRLDEQFCESKSPTL